MAIKRDADGNMVFSKKDMEDLLNLAGMVAGSNRPANWICPTCGTLHPTWEWAKHAPHLNECPTCKDLPSMEDLTGETNDTTPKSWRPPTVTPEWPPKDT